MQKFQKKIEEYKKKYNIIIAGRMLIEILAILLILFQIFNVAYNLFPQYELELFYTALTLRMSSALIIIYIIFIVKNQFLNSYESARMIDKINLDKDDTYQSTLELINSKDQPNQKFLDKIILLSNEKVSNTKFVFPKLLSRKLITFYSLLFIGNVILFYVFSMNFKATWESFYLSSYPKSTVDYSINFTPRDTTLVSNSNVEINILNYNQNYDYFIMVRRDQKWRKIPINSSSYIFNNLYYSFDYYIMNDHSKTNIHRIEVYERPAVTKIKVIYDYPIYTGLKSEQDTLMMGNISALIGSKVKLIVETNNNIEKAWMIFPDGTSIKGDLVSSQISLMQTQLTKSSTYYLRIEDSHGEVYQSPEKTITVIPDLKPEISLSDYPPNDRLNKNQIVPLTIKLSDDYGLQNLKISYNINSINPSDSLIFTSISNKIFNYYTNLDFSDYRMYPGDYVTIWASVEDNLGEKHRVESDRITLTLPTINEIFHELEKQEEYQEDIINRTLKDSEILEEEVKKKNRDLINKKELEWQDKEEIKRMISQQEQLADNVDKSLEKLQEMIEEASKNEALTQETLSKMEKIKELMEDITTPEMQEMFEKMKSKMSKLTSQDFKEALEKMKTSMDDFNEKLERTLQMLEQLKKNQSLDKLIGMSKEIQDLQEKILERTNKGDSAQDLTSQQSINEENIESIKEELGKFQDMLDEDKDKQVFSELEKMQEHSDLSKMKQTMQNISQKMQNKQSSQTSSQQKELINQMDSMNKSLNMMQSMMNSSNSQALEEAKNKLIKEMIYYSNELQSLKIEMDNDPFPIFERMISLQEMLNLSLQNFFAVPEMVFSLNPKFMLDISQTMNSFNLFLSEVGDNKTYTAKRNIKEIQIGMNSMIFTLLTEENNQQSGGSGGMQDFMKQMQEMGEEQMAMNMLTQQLMQKIGQGKTQIDHQTRNQMRDLAANEQRLADNLKRMMQTNPEAQKQAQGLDRLIEELDDVSNKLRFNRLDKDLIQQQENILSRMLEASKSINKKDQSQRRKGAQASDKLWNTPEDLNLRFKELELNSLLEEEYKKYPREYQKVILEYLKRLNRN